MAILLNDNLDVAVNKPTDYRYGPYVDAASALSSIPSIKRYKGLTVGIIISGAVIDYWFKNDITDASLVEKTVSSSGGTGATLAWRGTYSAGTSYVTSDIVSYNGSAYICIANTIGVAPDSTATPLKWNLFASKGDAGAAGAGGTYTAIAGTVSTRFVATEGQTNFFPISGYTSTNADAYTVSVGGIDQTPIQSYTISASNGGTLTLTGAASAGAVVLVRSMSANVSNGAPIVWTGPYSAQTTYNVLDAVSYDGNSYICTSSTPILNIPPTITAKWDLIAVKGGIGDTGPQGVRGPAGAPAGVFVGDWLDNGTVYNIQDVVRYSAALWCKIANNQSAATPPSLNNSDWALALKDSVGIWRGDWSNGIYYNPGDAVVYLNTVYLCTAGTSGNETPGSSGFEIYWSKLIEGITGPPGADGTDALWNYTGAYGSNTIYNIGDLVTYSGALYRRNSVNAPAQGYVPTESSSWDLLASKGETGPAGAPAGIWRGAYNSGTTYSSGDTVTRNNAVWLAVAPSANMLPETDNGNYWTKLVEGVVGPAGPTGAPAGVWRGAYNSGASYSSGDTVTYNNAVWLAASSSSGQTPVLNQTQYWELLIEGIKGDPGTNGTNGVDGTNGTNGTNGTDGTDGAPGADGADALWNYTGAYNAGSSYAVGDLATYNGSLWYRKNANGGNVGDTPAQNLFWDLIAAKGADGTGGGGTGGNTTQIQGFPVVDTPPVDGQVLIWNGVDAQWEPGSVLITGGTITYNTVGVHYFDVPATARWCRLQATAGNGTSGTSGTDGQPGTTNVATDINNNEYAVSGADGVAGQDGEEGKTVKIANVVVAQGGAKGLGSGGGGGGGGVAFGSGGIALASSGNQGTPAPPPSASTGGYGGNGAVNNNSDPSLATGGAGTEGGGNGGTGGSGYSPDNQNFAVATGGAGGTNRGGGGGGGGAIALNNNGSANSYPGAGGKAGTPTSGGSGQIVDIPYNLAPFAGGQLAIQITTGTGDASITLTW